MNMKLFEYIPCSTPIPTYTTAFNPNTDCTGYRLFFIVPSATLTWPASKDAEGRYIQRYVTKKTTKSAITM